MSGDVIDTPPPARHSMAAYWLASIRRMVTGAIMEGVGEDRVYDAVVQAIEEAHMKGEQTP